MLLYATYLLYAFNINLLALYLKTYFLNRPVISFPHIFYIEDTFYDISWIMKHAYYVNSDIKGKIRLSYGEPTSWILLTRQT